MVGRHELDRVAKTRGIQPPYREQDLRVMARELDASLIVTGEVRPLRFELGLDPPEIEERRVLSVRERSEGARRDERRQDRPGRQEHLERGAL